jgi:S1/P1 Nuclease
MLKQFKQCCFDWRFAKVKMAKILTGFSIFLCLQYSVWAWNAEGHMVMAQIAYNHLNPVAKARCDALIAVTLANISAGTSNFVTYACWADDFKTPLVTGGWHYIDLPFSLDVTPISGITAPSICASLICKIRASLKAIKPSACVI